MGSSAKKKKEKKKDFQKPKLKVGKAKPKASNFTDTSFKAKSIVVNKQSISVDAPAPSAHFAHHVSQLKNRSDSQRAESLAFLTGVVHSTPTGSAMPLPSVELLLKLLPLVLDGSSAVRAQLLKLLRVLGARVADVRLHTETVLLYVHAAMSHLSTEIRNYSIDVLDWLLDCAPAETVGCAGGWTKTLACFMGLLGWRVQEPATVSSTKQKGWSSAPKASTVSSTMSRSTSRQLNALAKFLHAGLDAQTGETLQAETHDGFPLRHADQHIAPSAGAAFAHLNIFGSSRNEDADMLEDYEDRRRVFAMRYKVAVSESCEQLIREGGDLGRGAAAVKRALAEGLKDLEDEDSTA